MRVFLFVLLQFSLISMVGACPDVSKSTIVGPEHICIGLDSSFNYSIDSIPGCTYSWMVQGNNTDVFIPTQTSTHLSLNGTDNSYIDEKTKYVTVMMTIHNGCEELKVNPLLVWTHKNPPIADLYINSPLVIGQKDPLLLDHCQKNNFDAWQLDPQFCDFKIDPQLNFVMTKPNHGQVFLTMPQTTGTYPMRVVFSNGCGMTEKTWNMRVHGAVTIDKPIAGLNNFCKNAEITFTAQNAGGEETKWWCNGAKNKVVADTVNGVKIAFGDDLLVDTIHYVAKNVCDSVKIVMPVKIKQPYAEPLGMASINEADDKVLIAWEQTQLKRTVRYEVWKEYDQDKYSFLASTPFRSTALVVDQSQYVTNKAQKYKLRTYDDCGNFAESSPHRTVNVITTQSTTAYNLEWNRYEGLPVSMYYIYEIASIYSNRLIDSVPASTNVPYFNYGMKHPKVNARYRIHFKIPTVDETKLKTDTGPFSQSLSNVSEASLVGFDGVLAGTVSVYPNPASTQLQLITKPFTSVQIFSASGCTVFAGNANAAGYLSVCCSLWARGTYSVQLSLDDAYYTEKLILE